MTPIEKDILIGNLKEDIHTLYGQLHEKDKEIERIKVLLEKEYRKTFRGFGIPSYIDNEWQQFKIENNI